MTFTDEELRILASEPARATVWEIGAIKHIAAELLSCRHDIEYQKERMTNNIAAWTTEIKEKDAELLRMREELVRERETFNRRIDTETHMRAGLLNRLNIVSLELKECKAEKGTKDAQ